MIDMIEVCKAAGIPIYWKRAVYDSCCGTQSRPLTLADFSTWWSRFGFAALSYRTFFSKCNPLSTQIYNHKVSIVEGRITHEFYWEKDLRFSSGCSFATIRRSKKWIWASANFEEEQTLEIALFPIHSLLHMRLHCCCWPFSERDYSFASLWTHRQAPYLTAVSYISLSTVYSHALLIFLSSHLTTNSINYPSVIGSVLLSCL